MSKFIGRRLAVGVAKEASRGVGVAPTHWLNAINFGLFDKSVKARSQASTGGIWVGDQALVARKFAEGEISLNEFKQRYEILTNVESMENSTFG